MNPSTETTDARRSRCEDTDAVQLAQLLAVTLVQQTNCGGERPPTPAKPSPASPMGSQLREGTRSRPSTPWQTCRTARSQASPPHVLDGRASLAWCGDQAGFAMLKVRTDDRALDG